MDIAAWLRSLGLERYDQAFRDNEVDWAVLPKLTSDDLRDIGIAAVGHRRTLLDAIAALGPSDAPPALRPSIAPVAGSPLPTPGTPALAGGRPGLPRLRGREGWGWRPSGGS